MPSALEAAAERLAPTRAGTSYFDPAASQSVISRYANAGREAEDSKVVADAADNLLRTRNSLEDRRRNRVVFDREDEEYEERKAFKAQRGEFLESIAAIDAEADDFEDQISALYKSLPPGALQDDAVVDMLQFKRKRADDLLNERQAQTRRQEAFDDRRTLMHERYSNDPRLAVLSPEERNSYVSKDGDFDHVGAAQAAYEKTRQQKLDDQEESARRKIQLKIEADDKDLTEQERKLKASVRQHILGDEEAFPNQVEVIRRQLQAGKKKPVEDKDLKAAPGYNDAKLYESRKFESELESARNMPLEKYLSLGGKSDTAREKRTAVWNAAQLGKEQPAQPVGTKAAEAKQIANDKLVVGKRYRGADGSVKTYRGEGRWE